jgi:lipoate-protein ligase A
MIVALGDGKIEIVQERMNNYKLTKKQKTTLDKLIKEQIEEINKTGEEEKKEEARITSLTEINETLADTMRDYQDIQ